MILLLQANTSALFNVSDLRLIAPELILTVCACFALAGIGLAAVSLGLLWSSNQESLPLDGFYGMVRIDGFALLFKAIFLVAAALAIAISTRFFDIEREQ